MMLSRIAKGRLAVKVVHARRSLQFRIKEIFSYSLCYSSEGKGNAQNFVDIAVRAYTEPDVKWWMAIRRKDYDSMNAVDFAAFINALNLMGNQQAELILTTDKGYLPDGTRHPHSWSIVDNKELINWFVSLPAK